MKPLVRTLSSQGKRFVSQLLPDEPWQALLGHFLDGNQTLNRPRGGLGEPLQCGQSEDHMQVLRVMLAAASKCPVPLWTQPSMNLAFSWPEIYQTCTTWHCPHGKFLSSLPTAPCGRKSSSLSDLPCYQKNKGSKSKMRQGDECPWGGNCWGRWTNGLILRRNRENVEVRSGREHNFPL